MYVLSVIAIIIPISECIIRAITTSNKHKKMLHATLVRNMQHYIIYRLGHAEILTTSNIYTHSIRKTDIETSDKLENILIKKG